MPWKEVNVMELRRQFIRDYKLEMRSVKDLCAMYGISRQTGYNWIERYEQEGLADPMQGDWSADRSHVPHVVHNRTEERVEEALMQMRISHPTWGARKLINEVGLQQPLWVLPHESTVCDMLKRRGFVQSKPRRRAVGHPGRPSLVVSAPGDCWSVDFKGHFRMGNNRYCYPLTVTDNYSRYLLACQAMSGTLWHPCKAVFTRLFQEWGLPQRIRSDNGVPFAQNMLAVQAQPAVGVVVEAGHPARADPAGQAAAKRAPRAHAQDAEG
jgi:putative transposase